MYGFLYHLKALFVKEQGTDQCLDKLEEWIVLSSSVSNL